MRATYIVRLHFLKIFERGRRVAQLRHSQRIGLALFFLIMAMGCTIEPPRRLWAYEPYLAPVKGVPFERSISVLPFEDVREGENRDHVWMAMICFVPSGTRNLAFPEMASAHYASGWWLFDPSVDLARALALELKNVGLFSEVRYIESWTEGDSIVADFVLKGWVESVFYRDRLITYGLSGIGGVLWMIGFPMGSVYNELTFSLQLEEQKTGHLLLRKEYHNRYKRTIFWYSDIAASAGFFYETLLKELMLEIVKDIQSALA